MIYEIERKYLIKNDQFIALATKSYQISQGYICSGTSNSVRVRKKDNKTFITIKGESSANGLTRIEWEKPLEDEDFEILWQLCTSGKISKTRYEVPHENHIIEIDVFHEDNQGLIMAEIELKSEDDQVSLPEWLGKEVTGDPRYYNSQLALNPFNKW